MKKMIISFFIFIDLFLFYSFYNNQISFAQTAPIASERFSINVNGTMAEFPYGSNYQLNLTNYQIELLIVSIHGSYPIANTYLDSAQTGANSRGVEKKTLIIAPQFFQYDEFEETIPENLLYWENSALRWGSYRAFIGPAKISVRISTFSVLDTLIDYVVNSSYFPNLKNIVVLGHSAGGQMVNRYSASSLVESNIATPAGIKMKYLVMAPSSFLYLSEERRKENTFYEFEIPSGDVIAECTGFNDYGYGLDNIDYSYHTQNNITADLIRQQYKTKEILYLVGSEDNDPDDTANTLLSKTCESMLQGSQRLERATIFYEHLKNYYGSEIINYQKMKVVEGVGHVGRDLILSEEGLDFIFAIYDTSIGLEEAILVLKALTGQNVLINNIADINNDNKVGMEELLFILQKISNIRGEICSYNISPSSKSFDSSGGSGIINLTTQDGCNWTASSNVSWINITGYNGIGSGSISYSVAQNSSTSSRSGTVSISGKLFTVSQEGITDSTPNPALIFMETEEHTDYSGTQFIRYRFNVTNWQEYPDESFKVRIYDENQSYIYGFAELTPSQFNSIWFSVKVGEIPPNKVYIVLNRLSNGRTYESNLVDMPKHPIPELVFTETEEYTNYYGTPCIRYRFSVTNWQEYPDESFKVRIYDEYQSYIYGFTEFTPEQFDSIWFGVKVGEAPPNKIYVILTQLSNSKQYQSNLVDIP